jgi:hypothetical protein
MVKLQVKNFPTPNFCSMLGNNVKKTKIQCTIAGREEQYSQPSIMSKQNLQK